MSFFMANDGNGGTAIFWGVVTIVVVISQILKANKKTENRAGVRKEEDPDRDDAQKSEALEQFLQGLDGRLPPREKKKAAPPPPRAPQPTPSVYAAQGQKWPERREQVWQRPVAGQSPLQHAAAVTGRSISRPMDFVERESRPSAAARARASSLSGTGPMRRRLRPYAQRDGGVAAPWLAEIAEDLSGKDALRKAVVLREILGPPVGMQGSRRGRA